MVLQNYVVLQQGLPAELHFTDHIIVQRTITDALTGKPGVRNILEFDVDRLNGRQVFAKFSTMSEKLASKLGPYLAEKSYTRYYFTITQTGTLWLTTYTVLVTPRV